jgi:hypothetical protein
MLTRVSLGFLNIFVFALILCTTRIQAGNFTFPTPSEYRFIVGDEVNVTWDVVTPRISLYEECGTDHWILARKFFYLALWHS